MSRLTRFERPKNMLAQPRVVNRRQGVPLWQHSRGGHSEHGFALSLYLPA